jgi:cellulose biosynthesis protein BcsQ
MRTITCASPKGGGRKTTTALLLAVSAMQKPNNLRVALLDLNADQQNIPHWYLARGKLAGPRLVLPGKNVMKTVASIAPRFDLLVVDTPPVVDDDALIEAGVALASYVVVPVQPSILDIGAMPAIVKMCKERRKPFSFLLCGVTKAWESLTEKAVGGLEALGGEVMTARISHRMAYVDAMTVGKTGAEVDSVCRAEVRGVWAELQKRMGAANV